MKPAMNFANRIIIQQGDLTEMDTDAVVNAANNDLQLGGGVAGAIRRKGGDSIQRECNEIGSIPIGSAAVTTAGKLKARCVIHAASMQLGGETTAKALRSSTGMSLRLAADKKLKSIAFPAIGTGVAGFPLGECAEIMIDEVLRHLEGSTTIEKVYFVLFDSEALATFQRVAKKMQHAGALRVTPDEKECEQRIQKVCLELARYEHPLFAFEARPSGDGVELEIRYRFDDAAIHIYLLQFHPREIDNAQFPWMFQKQLYDGLHDYVIEMFTSNPQRQD